MAGVGFLEDFWGVNAPFTFLADEAIRLPRLSMVSLEQDGYITWCLSLLVYQQLNEAMKNNRCPKWS